MSFLSSLFLSAAPVASSDAVVPAVPADATVATGSATVADLPSDAEVFDRAADALEGIGTLTADFVQVSPSGREYTGEVSLARPGRLRFDYDPPNPQIIVASGGLVYVHDSDLETTDSYPVSQTPLKFLLDRRLDRDAAELRDVVHADGFVTLVLASTDAEMQGELALTFASDDMTLTSWAVEEPNGAVTSVRLDNVETGVRLNNRLFRAPEAGGSFLRDR